MSTKARISRQEARITSPRFIDLFCGIGGFRLAFERAGARCVFSSEIDQSARETYTANFGEVPTGDITEVPLSAIPSFDILCAGFPCQPFSLAGVSKRNSLGRRHGFADRDQGNLFFTIATILDQHRPAAFLLENVKNLRSHDSGRTFETILGTLQRDLGYQVLWKVIDSRSVVPQRRERIYIVGFSPSRWFEFPRFPSVVRTMADILESEVDSRYVLSTRLWSYLRAYAEKHRANNNGFGYGLVDENSVARTLSARYYKDGAEILVARGSGRNPRRLTPRECARLMGFPESFKIPVSDRKAYRQFGNSVVVPVVARIARKMLKSLARSPNDVPSLVLRSR